MTSRADRFQQFYLKHRIEDQKVYYAARRDEYRLAHTQALLLRNLFFLLSALSAGGAQWFEGTARGVAGVIAATMATMAGVVAAYDRLIGFPTLSKVFSDAVTSLDVAQDGWEEGDPTALAQVERILRIENGQWGQLALHQGANLADDVVLP